MGSSLETQLNYLSDLCGLGRVEDSPGECMKLTVRFSAALRTFHVQSRVGDVVEVQALNAHHAAESAALVHGGEWIARDHIATVVRSDGVAVVGPLQFCDSRTAVVAGIVVDNPKEVRLESV